MAALRAGLPVIMPSVYTQLKRVRLGQTDRQTDGKVISIAERSLRMLAKSIQFSMSCMKSIIQKLICSVILAVFSRNNLAKQVAFSSIINK